MILPFEYPKLYEDKGKMSIACRVQQGCECSDLQDNSYYLDLLHEETEVQIGSITCSQIYKTAAKQEYCSTDFISRV